MVKIVCQKYVMSDKMPSRMSELMFDRMQDQMPEYVPNRVPDSCEMKCHVVCQKICEITSPAECEIFSATVGIIRTMWGPLVISWFITPSKYSYNYHKP